jgi:hypothetical protein
MARPQCGGGAIEIPITGLLVSCGNTVARWFPFEDGNALIPRVKKQAVSWMFWDAGMYTLVPPRGIPFLGQETPRSQGRKPCGFVNAPGEQMDFDLAVVYHGTP